jgi:phosphatidylinositol glycan class P protein
MAPASRGSPGLQSKSTPNLPTLQSLQDASDAVPLRSPRSPRSPLSNSALSGTASVEDNDFSDNHDDDEDDDDDDDDDDEEAALFALHELSDSSSDSQSQSQASSPASRPLFTSRSQTHLPRTTTALFPPFYNRPPVPLPPSLTSLLRPSFSAATSRPTTPDSSDVELSTSASTPNLASITNSARHAPTVPRASPKVPTYEYYGFALYLGSSAAFLMYILWAYVPAPMLHSMGIHWYPNRWWALAVPCWLVVLVVYIYVALASYNTQHLTLPLRSCENLVDDCAQVAVVDRQTRLIARSPVFAVAGAEGGTARREGEGSVDFERYYFEAGDKVDWKALWNTGTDAVMDVPIGGVCEVLYGSDG